MQSASFVGEARVSWGIGHVVSSRGDLRRCHMVSVHVHFVFDERMHTWAGIIQSARFGRAYCKVARIQAEALKLSNRENVQDVCIHLQWVVLKGVLNIRRKLANPLQELASLMFELVNFPSISI